MLNITITGRQGTGKSTVGSLLKDYLETLGFVVEVHDEGTTTPIKYRTAALATLQKVDPKIQIDIGQGKVVLKTPKIMPEITVWETCSYLDNKPMYLAKCRDIVTEGSDTPERTLKEMVDILRDYICVK